MAQATYLSCCGKRFLQAVGWGVVVQKWQTLCYLCLVTPRLVAHRIGHFFHWELFLDFCSFFAHKAFRAFLSLWDSFGCICSKASCVCIVTNLENSAMIAKRSCNWLIATLFLKVARYSFLVIAPKPFEHPERFGSVPILQANAGRQDSQSDQRYLSWLLWTTVDTHNGS